MDHRAHASKTLSPSDYKPPSGLPRGAQVSRPGTPGSQSRTAVGSDDGRLNFLAPMFSIDRGDDRERDQLRKQYLWLQELTRFKYEQRNSVEMSFEASRNAFNDDGNLFMIVLRRYVQGRAPAGALLQLRRGQQVRSARPALALSPAGGRSQWRAVAPGGTSKATLAAEGSF